MTRPMVMMNGRSGDHRYEATGVRSHMIDSVKSSKIDTPEYTLDQTHTKIDSLESRLMQCISSKQLHGLLCDIEDTQSDLETAMDSFSLSNSLSHQGNLRSLEISRVELTSTLNHSRNLKSIMNDANSLSYKITERVRLLDIEKNHLQELKTYVDNVKTLKQELSRANDAIAREDWMIASTSISIIRNLPNGLINDSYVEFKVPSSTLEDLPADLLNRWIDFLEAKFVEEFNDAAANKDVNKLTRFFQYFPLIGKARIGLKCYSKFICNIISEQSRSIIRNVQNKEDSKTEFYSQLLFRLYQTISTIVNQHSKVIKLYYGKDVVKDILQDIQVECDLQSNLIYETYANNKRLDSIVEDIRQYNYPVLVKEIYNATEDTDSEKELEEEFDNVIELNEVSKVTDELSAMMNHWSMYCKFFTVVWNSCTTNSDPEDIYPLPLVNSTFGTKIANTIVKKFDTFCTFTVRRTLEKACTIESVTDLVPQLSVCLKFLTSVFKNLDSSMSGPLFSLIPEEPPVSSLVDDIIIILNTILLETLSTGELTTIKNMMSNIKRILVNDFSNIIEQRLKTLALKSSSNLLTKDVIQKIHQIQNPVPVLVSSFSNSSVNSPNRSSTPVAGINVSASDIANTGAMFMRSINAAISSTITGEGDADSTLFTGDDKDLKQFIIYVNSLSAMSIHLHNLIQSCVNNVKTKSLLIVDDVELSQTRKHIGENHNTEVGMKVPSENAINKKIENLLYSIPAGFQDRSSIIIEENLSLLFERVLKPRVLKLMNDVMPDNYMITLEENGEYVYLQPETNATTNNISSSKTEDPNDNNRVVRFTKNWNSLIVPFVTTLSKPNLDKLLLKIIEFSAIQLEKKIWTLHQKVSPAGSFKLEQDVSSIIGELTKFDYSSRSKFLKITQIIMIIGLDDDDDISVLEEIDEGMEWALTPSERTRARRLKG